MKHIAKSILKGLFVIVLFTGGSIALTANGVNTVSQVNAATSNQVYEYLIANEYTVLSLEPKQGTKYDWTARTILNGRAFLTTIYCDATHIIGNNDVPM